MISEFRYWPPARPDADPPYRTLTMPVLLLAGALDLSAPCSTRPSRILAWSMRPLAVLPEMFVYEIHCRDNRRRLTGPRYEYSWNLVMMRSGGFVQRLDGRADFYDATSAFVTRPGQERYAGHPAGPGDVSTGIWLSERLIEDHFDGGARLPPARITTSAGFDLAHRLLVAACRRGVDAPEAAERAYDLLARLEPPASASGWRSHATEAAHRALAAEYGFADQAHLTRVVRRHLRTTPAALRDLVTGARTTLR